MTFPGAGSFGAYGGDDPPNRLPPPDPWFVLVLVLVVLSFLLMYL